MQFVHFNFVIHFKHVYFYYSVGWLFVKWSDMQFYWILFDECKLLSKTAMEVTYFQFTLYVQST